MNFTELILELVKFFFDDVSHFVMLLVFIIFVQGSISKLFNNVQNFFKRIAQRYRSIISKRKPIEENKVPSWLKNQNDEVQNDTKRKMY